MKIPKKISIANIPTPLQKINYCGCNFWMKRDDLTGVELSGNKVRKLEYILYNAKRKNADYVFTCGGEQSNHARATAISAAGIGLKSKLFLWGTSKKNVDGNLFLSKMVDPEIKYLSKKEYWSVNEIMNKERQKYISRGKKVYIIPEGGSSPLGIWGYINFVKELKEQIGSSKINGILTAAGSGGTAAGLLVGAALYGINLKIFAVNVLYEKDVIEEKIFSCAEACVKEFKLNVGINRDNLIVMDGYSKEGYKHITDKKIRLIKNFAKSSGLFFDPAYTGKAFYAFNQNFLAGKKSSGVLFVHTGGLYGIFPKKKKYLDA
ncbi:1-aminocyclopropane-1-carboxylate deaminase/D-cysteine desulfhydrase [Bacteroidota bacterium]